MLKVNNDVTVFLRTFYPFTDGLGSYGRHCSHQRWQCHFARSKVRPIYLLISRTRLQIQVQHPAGKSMIEISRTQDEEVGDGTTSVIILGKSARSQQEKKQWSSSDLAGELLAQAEQYLQQGLHATVVIRAYRKALEDCIEIMKTKASIPVDIKNRAEMLRVVKSCIGTKYLSRW